VGKGRPKPKIPMYTPAQRMAYVKCPCDPKGVPQEGKDDNGGFKVYPSNICPTCHEARTLNGTCSEFCPDNPNKT